MSDRLSALPDDILCYLLSFFTLRDSVRTRLLSPRWRFLFGHHSVLTFDSLNVFGSQKSSCDSDDQSKFVSVVDQILETLNGRNLSALKVRFFLDNEQASHIDRWVESGIRMEIETLELDNFQTGSDEKYVLSDQLFHSGKEFHMKCLGLGGCALTFSSGCTSWISHLTTLELDSVPLHKKDIECVLSGGLNLTSLSFANCGKPMFVSVKVELPRLKKLFLDNSFEGIELSCPNLELFVCADEVDYLKFSRVPLLTKVDLMLTSVTFLCWSLIFDDLARHAPKLQALRLCGISEEVQPLPGINTMSCLKRLDIIAFCLSGSDLFTVTYFLNASPILEIIHLEVVTFQDYAKQTPPTVDTNWQHIHLKEVKLKGFRRTLNEREFVRYLLKNAVALQQMVIVEDCGCPSTKEEMSTGYHCALRKVETGSATCDRLEEVGTTSHCTSRREGMATTLLHDIKTSAQLVFMTWNLGVVLNASNRVDCGVQLFYPGS